MNRELIGRIKNKRNKGEHYANIHGRTEVTLNEFLKGISLGELLDHPKPKSNPDQLNQSFWQWDPGVSIV